MLLVFGVHLKVVQIVDEFYKKNGMRGCDKLQVDWVVWSLTSLSFPQNIVNVYSSLASSVLLKNIINGFSKYILIYNKVILMIQWSFIYLTSYIKNTPVFGWNAKYL